ncbi:MAG: DNA-3-methyladenine glycosylase I [Flavobacteriales bacterium]|nr:DNA-3-methyladenine glycosylase I [Flavobacteriales bacterium]MCB9193219.1 DNA-3-methyladenine glycosylase I [Flavobacteriales bacterium]
MAKKELTRCPWPADDPRMVEYHDTIWGTPEHDDRKLYAKLVLDGAQAGLSWKTILHRSEGYRKAFDNWNVEKIARYGRKDVERLLSDEGIIRNRAKVASAISNAQAWLKVMEGGKGSFNDLLWKYVDHRTIVNHWKDPGKVPASTPISDALSKELKKAGFSFVGTTIVYAYMQAIGMVDDHMDGCFRKAKG